MPGPYKHIEIGNIRLCRGEARLAQLSLETVAKQTAPAAVRSAKCSKIGIGADEI